jgi:hypothetical protein
MMSKPDDETRFNSDLLALMSAIPRYEDALHEIASMCHVDKSMLFSSCQKLYLAPVQAVTAAMCSTFWKK